MTPQEKARLSAAAQTISTAVVLIRRELPVIDEALTVSNDHDSERRVAMAIMRPLLIAAKNLVDLHDLQVRSARAALTAVNTK